MLGFIYQLKGRPKNQRYRAEKILTDHCSDISYIHLQKSLTYKETFQDKMAFETYSKKLGIKVRYHHAKMEDLMKICSYRQS